MYAADVCALAHNIYIEFWNYGLRISSAWYIKTICVHSLLDVSLLFIIIRNERDTQENTQAHTDTDWHTKEIII